MNSLVLKLLLTLGCIGISSSFMGIVTQDTANALQRDQSLCQPTLSSDDKSCVNTLGNGAQLAATTQLAAFDPSSVLGGSADGPVTTCAYENVGWLICPILRSAAMVGDNSFGFVSQNFLTIEVGLLDSNSGTMQAWKVILNIANVLFVIVFLATVYTLITGGGMGNYNLKKLIPRFIIAAILTNISYYICQLLIDASNIIGVSGGDLLRNIAGSIGTTGMPYPTGSGNFDTSTLVDITTKVIGDNSIAWILLGPLMAVVLSIALICSIIIVLLIIRKTLVIALILIAPIAFVAYLLPSTEQFFTRWRKTLLYVLILFPIISILMGTGQIVSASIIKAGSGGSSGYAVKGDDYNPKGQGKTSATLRLVAAGAAVLPLVGTWYAFKMATQAMEAAGARISQGRRRSERDADDKTSRREQATMDLNKKSMMLRGVNRLQQINSVKDGDSNTSVFGRIGGAYRGRKRQTKSAEQANFDNQVQQRLSQIRSGAGSSSLSPQQMYTQALQRYEDHQAGTIAPSSDGQLNINSFEGIDLKASEAYLLESLSKGTNANLGAVVGANGGAKSDDQKEEKKAAGISSLNRDGKSSGGGGNGGNGSGGGGQSQDTSYRPPTHETSGAIQSAVNGGAAAPGQTIIVQAVPGSDLTATGTVQERRSASNSRPAPLTGTELQAKARAAKYLSSSQDAQLSSDDDLLTPVQTPTPTPPPEDNPLLKKG